MVFVVRALVKIFASRVNKRLATQIERGVVKAVNLTPANYLKNGMNLRSLEAIFTRPDPGT